jgi:hypothetical protein
MKNIHVLKTDKPSNGYILGKCIKELSDVKIGQFTKTYYLMFSEEYFQPQNIYITNSEEIKEGDYVYRDSGIVFKITKELLEYYESIKDKDTHKRYKIILTTDQDLIKDGVQAIDDDFLEWFVKNPSCEEVVVIYEPKNFFDVKKGWEYKIIIPKEEPKHPKVLSENGNELFFDEQGNLIKQDTCDKCNQSLRRLDELELNDICSCIIRKQETLEEVKDLVYWKVNAEEDYLKVPISVLRYISELENVVEKSYSEEEVLKLVSDWNYYQSYDDTKTKVKFKDWFQLFKKK